MDRKGFVCTSCGNKKLKLSSTLEYGFQKRRQEYKEQRYVDGVSDLCNVCESFTFFLSLDDKSKESRTQSPPVGRNALETPPSTKPKGGSNRQKKKRDGNKEEKYRKLTSCSERSKSCESKLSRRSQSSTSRVYFRWSKQQGPMFRERSQSGERNSGGHAKPLALDSPKTYDPNTLSEYEDRDPSTYEIDNYGLEDDEDDDYRGKLHQGFTTEETDDDDEKEEEEEEEEELLDSSPSSSPPPAATPIRHQDYAKAGRSTKKVRSQSMPNDLQKRMREKRKLISKLSGIRQRLDTEYKRAKSELKQLEYEDHIEKQYLKKDQRERGGAHIIMPEIYKDYGQRGDKKDKGLCLEDRLVGLIKEKQSTPSTSRSIESDTSYFIESESDSTPLCCSMTASTISQKHKPSLHYILPPLSKRCSKTSSKLLKPSTKLPRVCYAASSVQRAVYQGFVGDPRSKMVSRKNGRKSKHIHEYPYSQFITIPCNRKDLFYLIDIKPGISYGTKMAQELIISRAPIYCPDYDCKRMIFIADFNRHLLYDHRALTMERINVRQTKTFFLDANIVLLNRPKCHVLFLVRDKIIDTHSRKLRELLPVLVMTSRVRLSEMFGFSSAVQLSGVSQQALDAEMFVLWLTSFVPKRDRITGTICVWSTRKSQLVNALCVHTSGVYDVRGPQDMCSICSSPSSVIIPGHILDNMTNNGNHFLAIQVQLY